MTLPLGLMGLVLIAALCHATWNAFVKAGGDKAGGDHLGTLTVVMVTSVSRRRDARVHLCPAPWTPEKYVRALLFGKLWGIACTIALSGVGEDG